jgi:hypothetical protein
VFLLGQMEIFIVRAIVDCLRPNMWFVRNAKNGFGSNAGFGTGYVHLFIKIRNEFFNKILRIWKS